MRVRFFIAVVATLCALTLLLVLSGCNAPRFAECLVWSSGSSESTIALTLASVVAIVLPGLAVLLDGPGARTDEELRLVRFRTTRAWLWSVVKPIVLIAMAVSTGLAVAVAVARPQMAVTDLAFFGLLCAVQVTQFLAIYTWLIYLSVKFRSGWPAPLALMVLWITWLSSPSEGVVRPPWPPGSLIPLVVSAAYLLLFGVAAILLTRIVRLKGITHGS